MLNGHYRVAPPGFTREQWDTFCRDGIIIIENALSADEVERYLAAIQRVTAVHPKYQPVNILACKTL